VIRGSGSTSRRAADGPEGSGKNFPVSLRVIFWIMNLKGISTILLLVFSNTFMTFAWYGQLKMREFKWFQALPLFTVILLSWGVAFFEYSLMVPANRMGYKSNGGPFSLVQLKVIQEAITLMVFMIFSLTFFKNEPLKTNHLIGFVFLLLAVYFIFKD
jgi:uncharacterized protein (DUF486 family)